MSRYSNEIISSLERSSNQDWIFGNVKYFKEFVSSEEQLLQALDNLNKDILVSNEDTNLSAEIDHLSTQYISHLSMYHLTSRLSDAQFRLFTAQLSHAYLISLGQPPTPIRNTQKVHVYTLAELKSLQNEIETLVAQCQEATKLLTKQMVLDHVSVSVLQGRVDQMEKELDVVERIEVVLEDMIGRMFVLKELLLLEMSKIEAYKEILSQLGQQMAPSAAKKSTKEDVITKKRISQTSDVSPEIIMLQSLTGIRNTPDVKRILEKKDRIDKELYEANLRHLQRTIDETYMSL